MSKTIITHINPDPDAITSVWLLRRFEKELSEASVKFVNAGETIDGNPADTNSDIIHVDTGGGQFDHHDTNERTCAAKRILDYLQNKYEYLREDEALERLVEVVIGDDHFEECDWPEALADRYSFMFSDILDGLKRNNTLNDHGLVDLGCTCLDGIYTSLKLKIEAEEEVESTSGRREFETKWGKGLAIISKNDEVLTVGMKSGFVLVVRKDPEGMVRIKAQPKSEVDLTEIYEKIRQNDPEATWFLHASKKMLLNGSYKNPGHKFSRLGLEEIIETFKQD